MQIRTVKISNLSPGASARDIRELFSSSGEIEYIELHRFVNKMFSLHKSTCDNVNLLHHLIIYFCSYFEQSQIAYVTFKDSKGADNAVRHSVIFYLNVFTSRFYVCIISPIIGFSRSPRCSSV